MQLYGLKNCDTCRTAKKALLAAGHDVVIHDVRDMPLSSEQLSEFLNVFDGSRLINKASTTWRGLDDAERAKPALTLLSAYPALMKRPVIVSGDAYYLGWGKDVRAQLAVD